MTDHPTPLAEAMDVLVRELAKLPPRERAATAIQIALMMEGAAVGLLDKYPEILEGTNAGDR